MRKFAVAGTALLLAFVVFAAGCSNREETPAALDQTALFAKPNPDPGPDPTALPMNLSFPVIWTDIAADSLLYPYINKTESITKVYTGSYPGMTDAEIAYLQANEPWYPQPPYANENTWVAEYLVSDAAHDIYFIDWGNPLENINPIVGQRFPVEVALYEKIGGTVFDEFGVPVGFEGTTMEAFKMACLEYISTRDELFGTNKVKFESCFATVLTSKFRTTVRKLDGGVEYEIRLDPAVGPSGKMNFASANGGWTPTESGWHRITLWLEDPNISILNAVIENDEHFEMETGVQLEELSRQKKDLSGIYYMSTWIDVYVVPKSGKKFF